MWIIWGFHWFLVFFGGSLLNFDCLLPMAIGLFIQIEIYKYNYASTNTQIQIYRYKYTSTSTENANTAYQTPVLVGENSSRLRALLGESQGGSGHFLIITMKMMVLMLLLMMMAILCQWCQWRGWLGCDRWCGHDEYNETALKVYYTEEYNGRLCLCST